MITDRWKSYTEAFYALAGFYPEEAAEMLAYYSLLPEDRTDRCIEFSAAHMIQNVDMFRTTYSSISLEYADTIYKNRLKELWAGREKELKSLLE